MLQNWHEKGIGIFFELINANDDEIVHNEILNNNKKRIKSWERLSELTLVQQTRA